MNGDAGSHPSGAVRPLREDEVPLLLGLIRELADYERSAHEVRATEELLHAALFGPHGSAYCHVVEDRGPPETVAGFALWFVNFSTWEGRHGIYLEDLFVRPEHRGRGLGMALLTELARTCVERGYRRLEWWVLDWNDPAIGFYRSIGAVPMDEWTVYRLAGEALERMASR